MAKKYDLAVKVGSYVDRNGQEKGKWQNIGVVLDGQYGPYVLLNRYFNPAGVPCDPGKDVITVSLFKPNDGFSAPPKDKTEDEEVLF
jgi:hypothetical protein